MINDKPKYDLDKIKFSTDRATFEKAVDLYKKKKVTQFKEVFSQYSAILLGTKPYKVTVSTKNYGAGDCQCYLGQNDILCKHLVALAIYALKKGENLTEEETNIYDQPRCSGILGRLSPEKLVEAKAEITKAIRYIKPYLGPSRIWFSYQNSLAEGCNRLSKIVFKLPVGLDSAKLLIDLLLRLDKKLSQGGVDDSDGTVGGFIDETVLVLKEFVRLDPQCAQALSKLCNQETAFGWEKPLLNIIDN